MKSIEQMKMRAENIEAFFRRDDLGAVEAMEFAEENIRQVTKDVLTLIKMLEKAKEQRNKHNPYAGHDAHSKRYAEVMDAELERIAEGDEREQP